MHLITTQMAIGGKQQPKKEKSEMTRRFGQKYIGISLPRSLYFSRNNQICTKRYVTATDI